MFDAGQRLSVGIDNSLSVIGIAALDCLVLVALALPILTTSFVLGMFILRERVNVYHILAGITSIVAIISFSIGNRIR
jgi:hypothetical protein